MPTAQTRPASIPEVQAAVRVAPPGLRILAAGSAPSRRSPRRRTAPLTLDISSLSGIIEYEPGQFAFTAWRGRPSPK